jgi:hypothetical protein
MFKKMRNRVSRHKYKIIGVLVISAFTVFNLLWFMITGEYLKISDNKGFLFALFLCRCVGYFILFFLIEKRLNAKNKAFSIKLLAFTIIFYESVVVFNIPSILLAELGIY